MGGDYKIVEKRLADAIHRRFGLEKYDTDRLKKLAKKADLISAYFEAVELAGFTAEEAKRIFGVPRGIGRQTPAGPVLGLDPLPTVSAEEAFLNRFQQLESQR